MDQRSLLNSIRKIQDQINELNQRTNKVPLLLQRGASGGAALPSGTGRGKVLQIIDDLSPGTIAFDWPRMVQVPDVEEP